MNTWSFGNAERGATLIVGLIMLLLTTLLVSGALTMSTVSLKAVGNMQVREEAIAAANTAVESILSTNFVGAGTQVIPVDVNNDGADDYVVNIPAPACLRVTIGQAVAPSSASLAGLSSDTWNTVWQLEATATDAASGTSVKVREGVRILLADADKNSFCP